MVLNTFAIAGIIFAIASMDSADKFHIPKCEKPTKLYPSKGNTTLTPHQ